MEIDCILGEFNIPPCTSGNEFVDSIKYMKDWIRNWIKQFDNNLDICCSASMPVPEDQLLDPKANEIGCSSDYDAYTERENDKPQGYPDNRRVAGQMWARRYSNISLRIVQKR